MPEVVREQAEQIAVLRGLRQIRLRRPERVSEPPQPRKPLGDILQHERW
jgi:hypothetical protein